jgi:DNA-binding CsgD family transcriptional regulator/tetratricopeptide (TPR) repeat protein
VWAIAADDAELSLGLASDLLMFWLKRGHVAEGRTWVQRALALADHEPSPARLAGLLAMAGLAGPSGDVPRATEALTLARQLGDERAAGRALHLLGGAALVTQPDQARALLEQALALHEATHDHGWHAMTLVLLGLTVQRLGDQVRAVSALDEAIALSTETGEVWAQAMALHSLGALMRFRGDPTRAAAHYAESLDLALELGEGIVANEALLGLAGVLVDVGQAQQAAQLFGAAEALREAVGISLRHLMVPDQYERDVQATQNCLTDEVRATAWAAGRVTPPRELLAAARAALGSPVSRTHVISGPATDQHGGLTAREREVLHLLAEGRTNPEIAQILYIGTRTVEYHVANILSKVDAANRRDAVARATRLGLI